MMPVQIEVRGPVDQKTLQSVADEIVTRMKTVTGLRDVMTSVPPQEPEVEIVVNRQRCADAGVSASRVGSTISTLVKGSTATRVDWQNQLTDVIVKLRKEDLSDSAGLLNLPITATNGNIYTLRDVASIESGTGAATLSRQNQQATIIVGANTQGRSQAEVVPDIEKALQGLDIPASVTWQFGGMQARAQSAYSSMYFALLIGLIFIYMVLASQFGSFIHPFTVMMALPLAIIGSVAAMLIANVELTVISMIGFILMMGVATKNSILLVDFIVRYRRQGKSRTEAVLEAGPVRLRPILMTSMSIILGMIPTAMAYGAAGTFRAPMAITVIGGVFSSTLLSLVVVPVVYTLLDDIVSLVSRVFHRGATVTVPSQETSPAEDPPRQDRSDPDRDDVR
jgi:HAE1 family hydrophobic/amphiphilic exporter-1